MIHLPPATVSVGSLFSFLFHPEDGNSMFSLNCQSPNYTALQARKKILLNFNIIYEVFRMHHLWPMKTDLASI